MVENRLFESGISVLKSVVESNAVTQALKRIRDSASLVADNKLTPRFIAVPANILAALLTSDDDPAPAANEPAANEPAKEPAKEAAKEPAKEAAKEPAKEPTGQDSTVNASAKESTANVSIEPSKTDNDVITVDYSRDSEAAFAEESTNTPRNPVGVIRLRMPVPTEAHEADATSSHASTDESTDESVDDEVDDPVDSVDYAMVDEIADQIADYLADEDSPPSVDGFGLIDEKMMEQGANQRRQRRGGARKVQPKSQPKSQPGSQGKKGAMAKATKSANAAHGAEKRAATQRERSESHSEVPAPTAAPASPQRKPTAKPKVVKRATDKPVRRAEPLKKST